MGVEPKIGGFKTPKMDGENHDLYLWTNGWFGGKPTILGNTQIFKELEDEGKILRYVSVHTELETHPYINLYQQAFLVGIPFIIGVAGGLPGVCSRGLFSFSWKDLVWQNFGIPH